MSPHTRSLRSIHSARLIIVSHGRYFCAEGALLLVLVSRYPSDTSTKALYHRSVQLITLLGVELLQNMARATYAGGWACRSDELGMWAVQLDEVRMIRPSATKPRPDERLPVPLALSSSAQSHGTLALLLWHIVRYECSEGI